MKNRTRIAILGIALAMALIYITISGADSNPRNVSESFIKEFYIIDDVDESSLYASYDESNLKKKYKKYLTDNGYDIFIGKWSRSDIMIFAYEKHVTVDVLKIELQESLNQEGHVVYNYLVTLELKYSENHTETVTEYGYVNLIMQRNKWKIDKLRMGRINFKFE